MDKKRKRIVIGFGIFLSFMALCTIIAKGIYTSGLPIVSVINPTSNSLVHEINVSGKVKEGQEYGVYVDSGLRVATIQIRKGESFSSGDPLFQIDTDDLRNIIETYEFEIKKLNAQKKEYSQATVYEKQNTQQEIARAAQDYELAEK
ncbi:MAG: efflux RND transporter periplasmic adaptor subunit [Lachnospiraceae bacterium]|nr:efflux RND transporter periplasmic adaptor subunit [Lachnospiraceae bacterium]